MSEIWLKTCLTLFLVMCFLVINGNALRADHQKGFKMCPGKQLGHVVSVEAEGPGCKRRNGQDQWPCFVYPGRDVIFKISFIHEESVAFTSIESSIYGIVKLRGFGRFTGNRRMGLKGEVEKDACSETYWTANGLHFGCPIQAGVVHTIQKIITVPTTVRFAQQNMDVEFKLTNSRGDTIICFTAPIINL